MKKLLVISIVAGLGLLSSCVTVMPANTPHVPLLQEKGDARMATNLVMSESGGLGANVQVASSPADKFYWGVSASYIGYSEGMRSTMLELGAGTYRKLGRSFRFDLSGGAGIGANNTWGDYNNQRLYVQPAFAWTSKRLECAIGAKYNQTYFNSKSEVEANEPNEFSIQTFDPFLILRFGGPNVRFQFLTTLSKLHGQEELVYPEATVSLGVNFYIGKKKVKL